ncbi:MAG: tRNA dihydrouridine synthase [Promethearchaeota archaeon]
MFNLHKDPRRNIFLAPLQNVTTAPYRNFCRLFHDIGLVSVPMLYMKRITSNPNFLQEDLYKIKEERPISIQLIGNDKEALENSIEYLESYEFDVLDINAGCPSRRAINSQSGGYLIKDLENLQKLLQVALKKSSRPISLKTRIGFKNSDNIKEIASVINESGINFITVHARTVKNRFNDNHLNLEALKHFKEELNIPIIGNGDIVDPITAKYFLDYTKVDGLMIGRGSIGNPEIFSQIYEYIIHDKIKPINNDKIKMQSYFRLYEKMVDKFLTGINLGYPLDEYKFIELKRNAIWLTRDIENSTLIRSKLSKTKSLSQLKNILDNYFKSE